MRKLRALRKEADGADHEVEEVQSKIVAEARGSAQTPKIDPLEAVLLQAHQRGARVGARGSRGVREGARAAGAPDRVRRGYASCAARAE